MNKDVVYIEPEEDITDIIGKIEGSKSKIVALVPPKKAGVFRSIVNIKLISKTAANADKTVVLVTTDPSIVKLAAATKMPVTKDLKSAPKVPEPDEEIAEEDENTEVVDVDEEAEEEEEEKKEEEKKEEPEEDKEGSEDEPKNKKKEKEKEEEKDDDSDKKEDKKEDEKADKPKKKNKLAESKNPVLKWIGTHQKLSIGIGVGFVLFVLVLIWMFAIAPAVTITLKLETLTGNFSENISFTDKLAEENVTEGKFYIEEKKIEEKTEVEFEATGKKNIGEKATGNLVIYAYLKEAGTVAVKAGTVFTYNSKLKFTSSEDVNLSWDGKDASKCDNKNNATSLIKSGCQVSGRVKVAATEPGAGYNVAAASSGWSTSAQVGVYSDTAMAGGTDKEVTVVQQSDVEKAVKELNNASTTTSDTDSKDTSKAKSYKDKLYESVPDGQFAIDSSYKQTTGDPTSSPAVGEQVEDGKKAKLTVTITATVFTIDETKLKEFITEKAKLEKGYKIYEMNDPFVENFSQTEAGYVGKLKTSYVAGSTVTENDVVETVKGKGIGTAKRDISDNFDGIKSIDITTSVPWVTSVPGNPDKITVIIKTEADKKEE